MRISGNYGFKEYDDMQVVSLDYSGQGPMKMVLILPKEKFGLLDVEKKLNGNKLLSVVSDLPYERLDKVRTVFKSMHE